MLKGKLHHQLVVVTLNFLLFKILLFSLIFIYATCGPPIPLVLSHLKALNTLWHMFFKNLFIHLSFYNLQDEHADCPRKQLGCWSLLRSSSLS